MGSAKPDSLTFSRYSVNSAFGAGAAIWQPDTKANTTTKTDPSLQHRNNQERVPINEAPSALHARRSPSLYPTTTSILLRYRTESTVIRSETAEFTIDFFPASCRPQMYFTLQNSAVSWTC